MVRHGPSRHLHPTVQTWDAVPEVLPVGGTIPSAPPTKSLLWHPYANHPRLSGHGLGLCDVGHQYYPTEEANEDIKVPLKPLRVPQSGWGHNPHIIIPNSFPSLSQSLHEHLISTLLLVIASVGTCSPLSHWRALVIPAPPVWYLRLLGIAGYEIRFGEWLPPGTTKITPGELTVLVPPVPCHCL